jgi:hypothetical protein
MAYLWAFCKLFLQILEDVGVIGSGGKGALDREPFSTGMANGSLHSCISGELRYGHLVQ